MRGKRLALRFVVVQYPDLFADELRNPDRECVRSSASAANVGKSSQRKQRIRSDPADAALLFSQRKRCGVVRALQHGCVSTLPDMLVLLWLETQTVQALLLKHAWKLRVVLPVRVNDRSASRQHLATQQRVNRV